MNDIPSPDQIFPHACRTSCFIKNVIKAPNISVGEYTMMTRSIQKGFEQHDVLLNYPEFGDHLIIGKFCQIA